MVKMNGEKFATASDVLDVSHFIWLLLSSLCIYNTYFFFQLIIKLDKNKDRKIDFKEWQTGMAQMLAVMDDKHFNLAFKNMAANAQSSKAEKKGQ